MKTSHVSLLAVISLSLALCACDSGDKKDTNSTPPPVPQKKSKTDGGEAPANPQPPEVGGAPKAMSEAPPPAPVMDAAEVGEKAKQLDVINAAAKAYRSRQAGQGMMGTSGKSIEQLKKMGKPAAAAPLTSLDQLVKAGLLKSIPEPPAGKKYVIDAKTQEVRLE